jgi:hypothetical protein
VISNHDIWNWSLPSPEWSCAFDTLCIFKEAGRYSAANPLARLKSFSRVAHSPAEGVGMK